MDALEVCQGLATGPEAIAENAARFSAAAFAARLVHVVTATRNARSQALPEQPQSKTFIPLRQLTKHALALAR